jgi:dienelactone hydrolase
VTGSDHETRARQSVTVKELLLLSLVVLAMGLPGPAAAQDAAATDLKAFEEQRTDDYAAQLESYLHKWLVDDYAGRAEKAWNRNYDSVESFLKSVNPNRRRWQNVVKPPELPKTGELQRQPHPPLADRNGQWLTLPLVGLTAEGLLAVPAGASAEEPAPLVIAQHGIGSCPERTFGVLDEGDHYHRYAEALLDAGFAVLAPMNLRTAERRNRIERLCRLADTSLPGIEFVRVQRLLDEVVKDPRVDGDRIGMWGVSLGGTATMFWMPLEPRIDVGIVAAWFNHRRNKMVIPDPRYSCFLETKEDHAFFDGWLTEFTDSDVVSLICPRPLMIQTGKLDRIAHWPQVVEEFEEARTHYEKLGIADRIKMDLHEGGHEPRVQTGVAFLTRWLIDEPQQSP